MTLLIVCSGNANPKIDAPSAIFVDLGISKEELKGVLFPRKTVPCVQQPSNKDDIGTILKASSSNTLPDENLNVNPVGLQLNWKVLEDIAEAINGKQSVSLNTLSAAAIIKKVLDENIETLTTALADKQFCSGKDATVVHEANLPNNDLKLLSSAFGTSRNDVEHSVFMKIVQGVVERLQNIRPKIDDFLKPSVKIQELKTEQMVVSESSSSTEGGQTLEEKNHAKGTDDDSEMVENQTSCSNTQDANNKKGKGKKNKKNKGKKK